MIDAKVPPGLPKWMQDHVDLYLSSRGAEGHMYTITLPNLPARSVPSMLLVTKGRKSGEKFLFPLFYGKSGNSYYVVASKGGAPEHPHATTRASACSRHFSLWYWHDHYSLFTALCAR